VVSPASIQSVRPAIAAVCQANGVKRLEMFGSFSRGDLMRESDVDFIVEFADPLRAGVFDRYLTVRQELESIFGRNVDLVEKSAIQNPILQREIAKDRILVYAS